MFKLAVDYTNVMVEEAFKVWQESRSLSVLNPVDEHIACCTVSCGDNLSRAYDALAAAFSPYHAELSSVDVFNKYGSYGVLLGYTKSGSVCCLVRTKGKYYACIAFISYEDALRLSEELSKDGKNVVINRGFTPGEVYCGNSCYTVNEFSEILFKARGNTPLMDVFNGIIYPEGFDNKSKSSNASDKHKGYNQATPKQWLCSKTGKIGVLFLYQSWIALGVKYNVDLFNVTKHISPLSAGNCRMCADHIITTKVNAPWAVQLIPMGCNNTLGTFESKLRKALAEEGYVSEEVLTFTKFISEGGSLNDYR